MDFQVGFSVSPPLSPLLFLSFAVSLASPRASKALFVLRASRSLAYTGLCWGLLEAPGGLWGGPAGSQDGLKTAKDVPRRPQDAPRRPQEGPGRTREAPETPPGRPKRPQDPSKRPQDPSGGRFRADLGVQVGEKSLPKRSRNGLGREGPKTLILHNPPRFLLVFCFQRSSKNGSKWVGNCF